MSEDRRPVPQGLLERVAATAAEVESADRLGADIKLHRARGQRTVVEYRFEGGLRLIAKRYPQQRDALASFKVQRALWEQGFGPGSPHRVPEPLGCFADWRVLIMRAAPGPRLPALTGQPGAWEAGVRAAAGWLAQLHGLSLNLGPREHITEGIFRLARRATKATAHHPQLEGILVRLIEELGERARSIAGSRPLDQTHGRYHAGHVFVAPESITVIDLDRVALADPAKDVGEFLHRLRAQAMRKGLGGDAAERATATFLDEYAAHAHTVLGGLMYYWSYSILSTLFRLLELNHEKWERRLEFYRAEFEDVPGRASTLSGLAR
jgi:hypothetical protein